jgi:hypothetical protein
MRAIWSIAIGIVSFLAIIYFIATATDPSAAAGAGIGVVVCIFCLVEAVADMTDSDVRRGPAVVFAAVAGITALILVLVKVGAVSGMVAAIVAVVAFIAAVVSFML